MKLTIDLLTEALSRSYSFTTCGTLPGSHEVAHVGDLDAQIDCTMRVVEAIYASRGMSWRDITGALVYLKQESFRPAWDRWLAGNPEFPRAHAQDGS